MNPLPSLEDTSSPQNQKPSLAFFGPAKVTDGQDTRDSTREDISYLSSPSSRLLFHTPRAPYDVSEPALRLDERLADFKEVIQQRYAEYIKRTESLAGTCQEGLIETLSSFHKGFGVIRSEGQHRAGFTFREYLPSSYVSGVSLIGEFNGWNAALHPMVHLGNNIWEIFIPDSEVPLASWTEKRAYKLKLRFPHNPDNSSSPSGAPPVSAARVSPWARQIRLEKGGIVNCVLEDQLLLGQKEPKFQFEFSRPFTRDSLQIYEVHVGVSAESFANTQEDEPSSSEEEACVEQYGTYRHVREVILPRVQLLGYNAILLVAVQEHAHYGSCGWHVTSPYAVSGRFGAAQELKELVDEAHKRELRVIVSIVCSHASPSTDDGIGGLEFLFRRTIPQWDALEYNFEDPFVMKYMLANLCYWIEEFNIDGFRFEGLGALLYQDCGVRYTYPRRQFEYSCFFGDVENLDFVGSSFVMQANEFIHELYPHIISISNDHTATPLSAVPISSGGLGFDYTFANQSYDPLIKAVSNFDSPANWSLDNLRYALDRTSGSEKRVISLESFETNLIAKRPLVIAFLSWETLHTIAVGGVAPHVTELAAALQRLGHEVHVFTRAKDMTGAYSVIFGVQYHEVTFALDRDFIRECANMCSAFVHALLTWEKEKATNFSLIHGHDWLVARAITALKGLGRRCVFTMHSTELGRCGNKMFQGDSARIREIEGEVCYSADRVICVSGVLADETRSLYHCDSAKIRVAYNGINVLNFDSFEIDPAEVKRQYGIGPLEPTILFVGRFVLQKGVDLLIEAVPAVLRLREDVKFVVVGDGHMRKDVEARAQHLNVAHAIRFVGTKTGDELKALYKMCDAVIVPSRNEPFGIVVLEAWSAHKCVIATNAGGPRDFVTPNEDGFLVDPCPNSIAWGCCQALQNFEHIRWMGERGRVKAAYSFSWDRIGRQTRDIYLELFGKSDASYGINLHGDCSLAQRVMGSTLYNHMSVFDDNGWIARGFSILRNFQVLCAALGGDAWLSFMGTEFSHPDWVDLPRKSNGFSSAFARRQLSLSSRTDLKYKHFLLFTAVLLEVQSGLKIFEQPTTYVSHCDETAKILAMERGQFLFVFNFHPDQSVEDFVVGHSLSTSNDGTLQVVFSTDENRFGGWGRLDGAGRYAVYPGCGPQCDRAHGIKVYLPSCSALVLTSPEVIHTYHVVDQFPKLNLATVDAFCSSFAS